MSIKFTILGCGSSLGVPRIDGNFGKCNPKNIKNYRTRCSALISSSQRNILIDTFNILPQNLIISEIGMGFLTDRMNFDFELGILIKIYLRFIVFFSSVFLAILYNIYHLLFNRKNKS
mgnify:CR=1 FL=1